MNSIYTSNDSLIYSVVRGGKNVLETRDKFSLAMHFNGVECNFDENYQPSFNIPEGYWSENINRDSLHYKRLIQNMYFTAWHWMNNNFTTMHMYDGVPGKETYPAEFIESNLDYNLRDIGPRFFMTVFFIKLTEIDFANKATKMPPYLRDEDIY